MRPVRGLGILLGLRILGFAYLLLHKPQPFKETGIFGSLKPLISVTLANLLFYLPLIPGSYL